MLLVRLVVAVATAIVATAWNISEAADSAKAALDLFNKGLVADQAHDYKLAVDLLSQSSELGYAQAQIFLGLLYTKGDGIPKDAVEGTKWLRRAADQGDNAAQFYVAMEYVKGEGVPQDNVTAYMWLDLAVSHSTETPWRSKRSVTAFQKSAETQRDQLTEKMSPAEIDKANKLVAIWKPAQ